MALRPYPGFVGPSYTPESRIAAYDELYNWYPERIESGTGNADARYWLAPCPGYSTLSVMPTSPGRAIFELNGTVYGLGGTALYDHIDTTPLVRAQGLSDVNGSVGQIIGNGDAGHQLLIRADTTLYALDLIDPISADEPLDPPTSAPTSGQNFANTPTGLAAGFFGYAYTFVIDGNGETTASPRIAVQNPGVGDPFGGGELLEGISKGVSVVTSVNMYRTEVQVSEALALTAQLKLVGAITDADVQWANPVLQFNDTYADSGPFTDNFTGDGDTSAFVLSHTFVSGVGYVTNGGINETLGPGATWEYVSANNSIVRTSPPADLNTISINYTGISLGANVPTTNTATVHVEALSVMDFTSNMIAYLDGYGLSLDSTQSQVRFSSPFNFTVWSALDVFQREDAADRWAAMLVNHKEIWLFGSETTSVYYHSGDADTPFQPIVSVFIQIGILAPQSAILVDGSPMWVSQGIDGSNIVRRANGYTAERVSTHGIEFALSQFTGAQLVAIEGSTYQEDGHTFYQLTVPTIGNDRGITLDYDATTGLWGKRGVWQSLRFVDLDVRGYAYIPSLQMTLSRTTGAVYRQSATLATGTDGLGIKRLRRAPHINAAQNRVRYSHFRLLMETGRGLGDVVSTDPGYDPQITLTWSDDGGQTWSSSSTVSAGKSGEFNKKVEWRQLGQATDRIFEVTCSAPVPWRLVSAFLDYSVGAS